MTFTREEASREIRSIIEKVKQFLSRPGHRSLSEADTRGHYLDDCLEALGWQGVDRMERGYFVKGAREFMDYLLRSDSGDKLVGVEAKPLEEDLTDKAAAQVVQYCTVEGIRWCVVTNMRQLHLYDQHVGKGLHDKSVFELDLLDFRSDEEWEVIFERVWLLSYESVTSGRLDDFAERKQINAQLGSMLLDPNSTVIKAAARALKAATGLSIRRDQIVRRIPTLFGPPPAVSASAEAPTVTGPEVPARTEGPTVSERTALCPPECKMADHAHRVLKAQGKPMHFKKIWERMAAEGHPTKGLTPWASIGTIMRKDPEGRFKMLGRPQGMYSLTEWG